MRILLKEASVKYEEKKSKFISYIINFEKFEKFLNELQKEHPKANHIVWAYRYLDKNQIIENQSDDGEPKGSAGKPTLHILKKQNIINSAIITVRYFGGIKLGVNGLVKAYTKSATLALSKAEFGIYKEYKNISFSINYKDFSKFEYFLKKFDAKFVKKEFLSDNIEVIVQIENKKEHLFEKNIKNFIQK
ncbi:YigZ family protein [Nitrosophilus kaiyonis]|uniref:YigZ family protein n=1 Tax=Nitrosophilus kaiyonis TaxID=2930200 RepID=UPI00248FEE9C|nr:YigZ family protein [Nitrosophilus kaiyonis]